MWRGLLLELEHLYINKDTLNHVNLEIFGFHTYKKNPILRVYLYKDVK